MATIRVTGREAQPSGVLEQELAPGFSMLPGGNLMYQRATDYPAQMAEIMAEYEARAKNPRYNPFGESPDSARRLEAELVDPFRAVFTASQAPMRVSPPRYFETGGDIVQVDPRTGRATTVFDTPAKNVAADEKRKVEATLLTDEIKRLNSIKALPMEQRIGLPDNASLDTDIAQKRMELERLFTPEAPAVLAAPTATPRIAIGAASTPLAPVAQPAAAVVQTNAPTATGPVRIVRDANGKLTIAK